VISNDNLDQRLRLALHDLDDRVHAHLAGRAPEPTRGARRPIANSTPLGAARRGLAVPLLAGFGVLALLIAVGWIVRPQGVSTPVGPSNNPAASRTLEPSQSAADAARDKVLPDIAAMPLSQRLAPIEAEHPGTQTQAIGPEGTWVISSPDISSIAGSCPNPPPKVYEGDSSSQLISCVRYTEILLMTPNLGRVIKAFPIADTPPQWLTLTPEAIYCGRQSAGRSMICRIDRKSMDLTGRTFPNRQQKDLADSYSVLSQEFPGTWTKDKRSDLTGFDQIDLRNGVLKVSDWQDRPTITLDPVTLKPAD
jgi:hypothetical protein